MKRKPLLILGILLGVLALCVILIWPMAPVWQRLGFELFCIQKSGSKIQFGPCSEPAGPVAVSPRQLPTPGEENPIPVIVDDDGSPDGMIALLFFLRNPLFEVKAVTISSGEAHPQVFAPLVQGLLAGFGRPGIPVGAGQDAPLEGDNAFPEPWRDASDDFWGHPDLSGLSGPLPAAQLIVDIVNNSPQPVMIFVSGTHTNLAEALRIDPGIAANIRDIHVMGGAIHVPGNIQSDWPEIENRVAEWNIWVDPLAADEVLASGVGIHLVPLDATNDVLWTESDAEIWNSSGTQEGELAGSLLQWMLDSWSVSSAFVWDLVAALDATDPALCQPVELALDILTEPGGEQGRIVISDQGQPVSVCLDPDPGQMRALAAAVLGVPGE